EVVALVQKAPALEGDVGPPPAEGEMLPSTYQYTYGESRKDLIERMRQAMDRTLSQLWKERRSDLPLASPKDAVILASIVEKETAREEAAAAATAAAAASAPSAAASAPSNAAAKPAPKPQPTVRPTQAAAAKSGQAAPNRPQAAPANPARSGAANTSRIAAPAARA